MVCSGQNVRQVQAIADAIEEALRGAKVRPSHVEGYDRAEWVLMDYFTFIVHVFTPQTRAFYSLERLWGDAERIVVATIRRGEELGRLDSPPPPRLRPAADVCWPSCSRRPAPPAAAARCADARRGLPACWSSIVPITPPLLPHVRRSASVLAAPQPRESQCPRCRRRRAARHPRSRHRRVRRLAARDLHALKYGERRIVARRLAA